jgi:hypothetical protein
MSGSDDKQTVNKALDDFKAYLAEMDARGAGLKTFVLQRGKPEEAMDFFSLIAGACDDPACDGCAYKRDIEAFADTLKKECDDALTAKAQMLFTDSVQRMRDFKRGWVRKHEDAKSTGK